MKYSTEISATGIEDEQFKAAVLHPKKQNLTVETLVLPETAADGMVRSNLIVCTNRIDKTFNQISLIFHRFVLASIIVQ